MRNLNELNEYRRPFHGMMGDETCGKFVILSENERFKYHVIASSSGGWDHVSVSLITVTESKTIERCPKWNEMCFIKDLFFEDEEEVIQFHPKKSEYVNAHPYVLHLWRPTDQEILTPPNFMV